MNETWKPVIGWPEYEVSSLGRVRSLKRKNPKILTNTLTNWGYHRVGLCIGKASYTRKVHILVAEAFIGPRPNGLWCLHRDGNKLNNIPSNLYWGTHQDNVNDAMHHGTHIALRRRKLTPKQVVEIRKSSVNAIKLSAVYKVHPTVIQKIRRNQSYKNV